MNLDLLPAISGDTPFSTAFRMALCICAVSMQIMVFSIIFTSQFLDPRHEVRRRLVDYRAEAAVLGHKDSPAFRERHQVVAKTYSVEKFFKRCCCHKI